MPFTKPRTFREVAQRLVPLQHRLQDIYDTLGYNTPGSDFAEIEDVRAATLMICKSEIGTTIMFLNIIASAEERIISEDKFRLIIGLSDKNIPLWYAANRASDYLRLSCVTMFQFRIENTLKSGAKVLKEICVSARAGIRTRVEGVTVPHTRPDCTILV